MENLSALSSSCMVLYVLCTRMILALYMYMNARAFQCKVSFFLWIEHFWFANAFIWNSKRAYRRTVRYVLWCTGTLVHRTVYCNLIIPCCGGICWLCVRNLRVSDSTWMYYSWHIMIQNITNWIVRVLTIRKLRVSF